MISFEYAIEPWVRLILSRVIEPLGMATLEKAIAASGLISALVSVESITAALLTEASASVFSVTAAAASF